MVSVLWVWSSSIIWQKVLLFDRRRQVVRLDAEPDDVSAAVPVLLPPLHHPASSGDLVIADAFDAPFVASAASTGRYTQQPIFAVAVFQPSAARSKPRQPIKKWWRHRRTILGRLVSFKPFRFFVFIFVVRLIDQILRIASFCDSFFHEKRKKEDEKKLFRTKVFMASLKWKLAPGVF